ncbi:MAG: T9SS type A sorting domain-containing protein [Ignavibacteriae bacterium]|nr:T9SS type A sorting domain-containing protein [Ignavibacteriota bacterium]
MSPQSHDFSIVENDSIVNNTISNFTCYSTNSIITGLVLENGGIPTRTYKVSAWTNVLNSYSEATTNGLGMFSIPVRSDTDLNLKYNVWLNSENDEYQLPPGMYVDTTYWDISPGANVSFNLIPADTFALDNFDGHNVGFSQELWDPYMYGNPFGNQYTALVIDSTLHIQTHSQSGRSGAGVVTKKPYNLNDRDIRVLMNRTQMGQQNSASILFAPVKRSGNAPDDFERWLILWTGDQGDSGWKLIENVNHSQTVLWETNSTAGLDIRFIFEGNSNFSLYIDGVEKYHGTWTNNFPMAYVYLIQENESSQLPTTVMFDEFRVRSRFSLDVREVGGETPDKFRLEQNYPNPFNPSTRIVVDLPRHEKATLVVYNIIGQAVATLMDGEFDAGRYEVTWTGRDDFGLQAPTGVYMYKLEAGKFTKTFKMLMVK